MRKSYRFSINGHGAEGAPFEVRGSTLCEFPELWDEMMKDTFNQLTNGRAIYGAPGVAGCRGPYSIRRILIEEQPQ